MKGLVVGTLKIGSPEERTGITLYDEVTGEPNCFSIANGTTKTMLGECTVIIPPSAIDSDNLTYSPADSDAPIITLDGDTLVSMDLGSTYVESGAFAQDTTDGTVAVVMSGTVDTSTSGTYTITYTATDSAGNSTTTTRIVNVGDVAVTDTTDSTSSPQATDSTSSPQATEPAPVPAPEPAPTTETTSPTEPAPTT